MNPFGVCLLFIQPFVFCVFFVSFIPFVWLISAWLEVSYCFAESLSCLLIICFLFFYLIWMRRQRISEASQLFLSH